MSSKSKAVIKAESQLEAAGRKKTGISAEGLARNTYYPFPVPSPRRKRVPVYSSSSLLRFFFTLRNFTSFLTNKTNRIISIIVSISVPPNKIIKAYY